MPNLTPIDLKGTIALPSIHPWRYSPFRDLASRRRRLHSSPSLARLLQPCIPRICDVSLLMTFSHLVYGFPTGLVIRNFPLRTFSGILSSSILTILLAHPSLLILISYSGISAVTNTIIPFSPVNLISTNNEIRQPSDSLGQPLYCHGFGSYLGPQIWPRTLLKPAGGCLLQFY